MKILSILLLFILLMNTGFLMAFVDKNMHLIDKIEALKIENRTLKQQMCILEYYLNSNSRSTSPQTNLKGNNTIPKGTLKFMKIALKSTHPDNGGNSEDFIRCNEIYKILSKYKEQ